MKPQVYSLTDSLRYSLTVVFALSYGLYSHITSMLVAVLCLVPAYSLVLWLRTYQAKRELWFVQQESHRYLRIGKLLNGVNVA